MDSGTTVGKVPWGEDFDMSVKTISKRGERRSRDPTIDKDVKGRWDE